MSHDNQSNMPEDSFSSYPESFDQIINPPTLLSEVDEESLPMETANHANPDNETDLRETNSPSKWANPNLAATADPAVDAALANPAGNGATKQVVLRRAQPEQIVLDSQVVMGQAMETESQLSPVAANVPVHRVESGPYRESDDTGETEQISLEQVTPEADLTRPTPPPTRIVVNPASVAGNSIVDPITGEIPTRASRRVATGELQIIQVSTATEQGKGEPESNGATEAATELGGVGQEKTVRVKVAGQASRKTQSDATVLGAATAVTGVLDSDQEATADLTDESAVASEVGKYRRLSQAKKEQRWRRRRRRLIASLVVVAVLAGVAIAGTLAGTELGGIQTILFGGKDYTGEGKGEVFVEIPEGASGLKIGRILEKNDVVASADLFAETCKKNSLSQGIQSGRFKLRKQMSAKSALAALLDPAYKADLQVTIPPGFTIEQVKERLINIAHFSKSEVEAAMANPKELGVPEASVTSLEGWVAPDTYTVNPKDTAKTILTRMVNNQLNQLDQAGVKQADRVTALIKASILEREVNQERYYSQVARVIDNRLSSTNETKGFLQMDSTVLYGVGQRGGLPSKEVLKQDTPYNTYLHTGLPPTPIGAPGLKALKAVVHPAAGSWLYFVTVNLDTGETKFSATHEEHQKYVQELKNWCEANPGKCSK